MVDINQTEINWQYSPKQNKALDIIEDDAVEEELYGGAKGGGKTVVGVRWVYRQCCAIIRDFNLKPSKYPIAVGFMGRKRAADFKKTTLETWKREVPAEAYEINEQKGEIIIRGTVKIFFGGFDDRALIQKFNSMELAFYFIDQAEEISEDEHDMLQVTLRLKINGVALKYKGLLTANPAQCWLKHAFVDKPNTGCRRYLQALPTDNPFLPDDYIPRLERVFARRPERLAAYLKGDWSALSGTNIVIKQEWLAEAREKHFYTKDLRRLVVCDPARFGDDECVIYYFENTKIIEEDIFGKCDGTVVANKCAAMSNKHAIGEDKPVIVMDCDGLGGPIADFLKSWGFAVIEIHSQAKSQQPDRFINTRAEMWWTAGEKYSDGAIEEGGHVDDELDRQLTTVQYRFATAGRIQIEDKEEIKSPKRLGRSPDRADTRIMGLWALQFISPVQEKILTGRQQKKSPMSM
ncbi:MAG: phage terminase large subunit [Candidatus Thermoplasmatota archaeon]|nr:phage terminase large subunit [Candidatus Thermoplasmatota archaeon]